MRMCVRARLAEPVCKLLSQRIAMHGWLPARLYDEEIPIDGCAGGQHAAGHGTYEPLAGRCQHCVRLPVRGHRGRLLVVNTASFCGYTRQYEGLQTLWQRYEKRGLVVIGVPSNDFGAQEPKSESEIADFCQGAFGITFPLTSKEAVLGPQAHPFYRWARETLGAANAPRWNFHKYLVGRDGKLIAGYGAGVEPLSPALIKAIETAIGSNQSPKS